MPGSGAIRSPVGDEVGKHARKGELGLKRSGLDGK